ncbi:hypothetical protein PDJAM_G00152940 [Pangasius djambal]|uniref:Uncharacterized protein n=1 Tax=Pangasius djambal TaxID=1691987 RepID=A0ACC5ZIA4_9TELE|nr:hypothetical protein [Pangasius djambal]
MRAVSRRLSHILITRMSKCFSVFGFGFVFVRGQYENRLNKYIRHYEGLSYDTNILHSKHQRAKRAVSHEDKFVHLEFHAHGRVTGALEDAGRCHCVGWF